MTSIIIAGRPNSEEMSECILVAENISSIYPSSRFTFVLKHPKEWEVYCEDICNLFGIVRKTYPLILFSNGKQIGGQKEFFKLIKETFNCKLLIREGEEIILEINREVVENLTKENSVLVEKEYIYRTSGMPIIDKIHQSLNQIPLEHYDTIYSKYNTIENDYQQGFIKDMRVYYKLDEKFTPKEDEFKEEEGDLIQCDVLRMETDFYEKKKEEEELRLKMLTEPKITPQKEGNERGEGLDQEGEEIKDQEKAEGENVPQQQQQETEKSKNKSSHPTKENILPSVMISEALKNGSQPKEIKFNYYSNLDIPISCHKKELFIEDVKEGDYNLIINPYFTFYGEAMINFSKEYVPPVVIDVKNRMVPNETINNEIDENQIEQNQEEEGQGEEEEGQGEEEQGKEEEEGEEKEEKDLLKTGGELLPKEEDPNQIDEKMKEEDLKSSKIHQNPKSKQDIKVDLKPETKVQAEEKEEEQEEEEDKSPKVVQKIPNPVYGVIPQIPATPNDKPTLYNPLVDLTKFEEDSIILKDYGRLPSLRIISYDQDLPFYESKIPPYQIPSQVGNSMNIFDYSSNLLNEKDLFALISAVNETQSYACLRILPYKYADWKSFGSNKIKIIPKKPVDLKHEDFPLKLKVDQKIQAIKRSLFKEVKKSQVKTSFASILHNSEFNSCFKLPNMVMIELYESLGIKHLIKYFPEEQFNVTNMKQALSKMMRELEIDNTTGNGFNLICCQEFVFLAPLVSPYSYTKSNIPLFAEPHFFMGVFTLPIMEAEWPESVNGKMSEFDFGDILIKSTN